MKEQTNGDGEFHELSKENYAQKEGTSVKKIGDRIFVSFPDELLTIDLRDMAFGFSDYEG